MSIFSSGVTTQYNLKVPGVGRIMLRVQVDPAQARPATTVTPPEALESDFAIEVAARAIAASATPSVVFEKLVLRALAAGLEPDQAYEGFGWALEQHNFY